MEIDDYGVNMISGKTVSDPSNQQNFQKLSS